VKRFKSEYDKEVENLDTFLVFDISDDLSKISVLLERPEGDLMWSDDLEDEFIAYIDDNVTDASDLDLDKLWEDFQPQSRWYLYKWKRNPEDVLKEIIPVIDTYANKLSADNIAVEIYDEESN
jgi:hypothetical protein